MAEVSETQEEMGVKELQEILEAKDTTEETEIIEIIETIEYDDDDDDDDNDVDDDETTQNQVVRTAESVTESVDSESMEVPEDQNTYDTAESKSKKARVDSDSQSSFNQQVSYQADEDWSMEEHDPLEIRTIRANQSANKSAVNTEKKVLTINGSKASSKASDVSYSTTKSKSIEYDSLDENSGHEIVKNAENDLVYTVLGSKKETSKRQEDSHYIKMERLDEDTIPVEGTIYYEGDDMGTLYMAQAIDDSEQYQYVEQALEQEEQEQIEEPAQTHWEEGTEEYPEEQAEDDNQDQIFLHEDEDGQLYFKDDTGTLQPVYLTEDGTYSFGPASDDQEISEPTKSSQKSSELAVSVPDVDSTSVRQGSSIASEPANDMENEDNTVTISLIISEDENGLKRTQVIIPTTDNLKCEICMKTFKTQFQLLRHNRLKHAREEDITTRNFPCDLCPKRFPDQNSLARHRRTHTGDRPFQCLECQQTYPTAQALRRHMTMHNPSTKPQPCIYCGRRFLDKPSLQKHEDSHLAGENQRGFNCDICGKSFISATDLLLHKKNHDPDKKFDCETCGREFNRLNNLQRHMLVHQQVREKNTSQGQANQEILSCDVCGITYKFMSSLTRHMVTSHMNPEKRRQQAEEQRRKRENNYKRYLENRKMYETQNAAPYGKRSYRSAMSSDPDDDLA